MVQETKNLILTPAPLNQAGGTWKTAEPLGPCSPHSQVTLARQRLEKLHLKFPHLIDFSVFREINRIAVFLEDDFIEQRTAAHLAQLSYSIALVRKKLSQEITLLPLKSSYDIRLMPFSLQFTFGSKPVLGILAHASLQDKYKAFDEEHVLLKIRRLISEAQLVKGSVYAFQPPKSAIKTLYFEIDKKSGLPFSSAEIKRLKAFLKQEIEYCVEKLIPCIFMARNEEEVLKNILTLSREIKHLSDVPEVMILLDQQTTQEAIFTVIVVQIAKPDSEPLAQRFSQIQGNFTFFPERSQTVRYLKKKHPIEVCVFRIHLPKEPSILRSDLSINFYLARQKVCTLLTQAIGDFRDFNGGIILKQRENLTAFVEAFPELSSQNPDLLETFFYSINPIEAQTFLPITSLKYFYELFLKAFNSDLLTSSGYFLEFHQTNTDLLVMIRLADETFKQTLDPIFSQLAQSQIATSTLYLQNSVFLGFLITRISSSHQEELKRAIIQAVHDWKQRIDNQKILKLGLEYPVVSLDPRIGGDHASSLLLKMLFEGLMRENSSQKIDYGIAKSVEISSDLKTYLFSLRKARWSDGSLVTAFDFEYAWKKTLSPGFKTPFAYLFYPIKNAELAKNGVVPINTVGIQALDEFSLKVELKSPTPYFLELAAHTIYSPIHRLTDQLHPNWPLEEGSAYVCNGAFQLMRNQPKEGYALAKNPLYWDRENIQLDEAWFTKMSSHQAFERFENNNNHWIGVPLTNWNPSFTPSQDDQAVDFPIKSAYWYTFNCEGIPFKNKKMRQAFSMAIDRSKLGLLFNTQPIISPLPLIHSLIDHSPSSYFNMQKAQMLFEEALREMNLSKENFAPLSLIYPAGSATSKLAEILKEFWEAAFNIKCSLESLSWNILFSRITQGDYQIGGITWQPWVNDSMYTLNAFRHANDPINFPKWENAEYQKILDGAEREINSEKRQKLYLLAEELLLNEMPVAPIFSSPSKTLKKKNLKIQCSSSLVNFKWAYFESS